MTNVTVTENAKKKAQKYQLTNKFKKQTKALETDSKKASLWLKPLEKGRKDGIWKFRIDKHYWGLVLKTGKDAIKVYDVIKHL